MLGEFLSPAPCGAARCSWPRRWPASRAGSRRRSSRRSAPASDQIGQKPRLVGQWPHLRLGRLGEVGDHRRIDRIGLGALAERLGEGAHLGRIDHHHGQAGRRQGSPRRPSRSRRWPRAPRAPATRLPSSATRSSIPAASRLTAEHLSGRAHVHVQPILRYIDANDDAFPSDPILAQSGFASGPGDCSGSMDTGGRSDPRMQARAIAGHR